MTNHNEHNQVFCNMVNHKISWALNSIFSYIMIKIFDPDHSQKEEIV